MLVAAKVGFAIRSGEASFPTPQTEAVDLSFFPITMTSVPGTTKSSTKPKETTLKIGKDVMEMRHLSRLRERNSVVPSTPPKAVQTNGIAHKERYIVVTLLLHLMAELVLPQTMEDISAVERKPASTPPWGGGGNEKKFPGSPPPTVEAVGLQLQCAKHLAWLGRDDLLQVPWCKRFQGLVVVINLWSGFGGALFALLAAGSRVIALTSERSDDGTEALLCAFPAAVHKRRVEDIHVEMFQPLLRRRSVSVILVGGKDPCHISTSHQPLQLAHFIQGVTDLPEVREASTQVIGWLESTSSVPDEVKCKYDELLGARHFEITASDFGHQSFGQTVACFFLTVLARWSQHEFQNSFYRTEANSDASPYREWFLAGLGPTRGYGVAFACPSPFHRRVVAWNGQ